MIRMCGCTVAPGDLCVCERAAARPEIAPFDWKSTPKPWGEEILVAHVPGEYAGKILKRYAREPYHRAGLTFHESRMESFALIEGTVIVYWVDTDGVLRKRTMNRGQTFDVPPGAVHSVQTITDSVMFETSNGAFPDAVNVEADYAISTAIES